MVLLTFSDHDTRMFVLLNGDIDAILEGKKESCGVCGVVRD
jgi:hypothetical protein